MKYLWMDLILHTKSWPVNFEGSQCFFKKLNAFCSSMLINKLTGMSYIWKKGKMKKQLKILKYKIKRNISVVRRKSDFNQYFIKILRISFFIWYEINALFLTSWPRWLLVRYTCFINTIHTIRFWFPVHPKNYRICALSVIILSFTLAVIIIKK